MSAVNASMIDLQETAYQHLHDVFHNRDRARLEVITNAFQQLKGRNTIIRRSPACF